MRDNQPLISICIPTYNRPELLYNTIQSIYDSAENIDFSKFEVIISDNNPEYISEAVIKKFNYSNLKYIKATCVGFLNSYNSLKEGRALFLKLHNDYSMMKKGTMKLMIDEVSLGIKTNSVIYFTDGLREIGKRREYDSFNLFMNDLSYFSSWSSGFGIWKNDLDELNEKQNQLDKMFPQTTLLLFLNHSKRYVLNDLPVYYNQKISKKGGYNIFKVFLVDYISLIKESLRSGFITESTYDKIKNDLLFKYLSVRYYKTVIVRMDNFEHTNIKKNISINYTSSAYYFMIFYALLAPIRVMIRKYKIAKYNK